MRIEFRNRHVVDLEVDGVDTKDYPDFCDAFICGATWDDTGLPLNDEEIDAFQSENSDLVYELVEDSLF